jgi:hypothetical protein
MGCPVDRQVDRPLLARSSNGLLLLALLMLLHHAQVVVNAKYKFV